MVIVSTTRRISALWVSFDHLKVRLEASNNDGQVHHLLQPAEVENHASVNLEVLASSEHELAQTAAALVVGYTSVAAANVVFYDVLLLRNVVSVADAFSWSETHV
ncbi:hypothetical protein Tco_0797508 [Tanacetum coccineum]